MSKYPQSEQFGITMKTARKLVGMRQEQLAKLSGLSRATISFIERGRQSVTLEQSFVIANILKPLVNDIDLEGVCNGNVK